MAEARRPGRRTRHAPDAAPPDVGRLPRQRRGISPQMVGRYPDYDVLELADTWDDATRRVVMERLESPVRLGFFSVREEPALRAFCDTVTAQDAEPRIPVAEMIDRKLRAGRLDGYQHADLPDDGETWRRVLAGLEHAARRRGVADGFARCSERLRQDLIDSLERGTLKAPELEDLNVARAWRVCMRMALAAFYAHPWAWNEIGFGGPAYPRGFMRAATIGGREPGETPEAFHRDPVLRRDGGER